jgi:hypothetical protein
MRRSIAGTVGLLAVAVMLTAGCDNDGDETPTPTTPTPTLTTDTFTGELRVNGAITHTFNTAVAGDVTLTLKTLAPEGSPTVGLALGTFNGSTCAVVIDNTNAAPSAVVFGRVSGLGSLCARVYDAGKLTDTVTYEITVVHP